MNVRNYVLAGLLVASFATDAMAQNNATTLGTEGPASNSTGYPSAANPAGQVATTQVAPTAPRPRRVRPRTHTVTPQPK